MAATLGPMETVIVSKFIKTLRVVEGPPPSSQQANLHNTECNRPPNDMFQTGTELLYGGQGKTMCNNNLTPVSSETSDKSSVVASDIATHMHEGLDQPRLEETNAEVTGSDKRLLCLQNKRHKQRLRPRAAQLPQSQWTVHRGQIANDSTVLLRTRGPYRNSMCPTGRALSHPTADILSDWAKFGCPTRTGRNWTTEEMWEAVERGPHQSATSPEALTHFDVEIKEKLGKRQARLVPWDDIKDNPPAQLKISPIAAIPYKSKAFRSILDLSFHL